MKANLSQIIRNTALLAGAMLTLGSVRALGADKALPVDAFPTFDSYIKISGQAADVSGNSAAFRNRMRQPDNGGLGIEDLRFSKDMANDVTMEIDGRALTGLEDYLGKVKFTKNEVGSFEAGYKRFRTFYDGVGGFFPVNNQWMPLTNQKLNLDRGKLWAEATIALPGKPVLSFKYTNETRNGLKDSTIMSSSDLTGLPINLAPNPITMVRKLSPSYIDISERHEEMEASVRHTFKNTTVVLTVLRDSVNNLDTRVVTSFPGEFVPFAISSLSSAAQPAAKALVSPIYWGNQQVIRQSDGIVSHTNSISGKSETVINDMFTLSFAGSAQFVSADQSGDRPLVTTTDTPTGPVLVNTATFTGLTGTSKVKVFTGNVDLDIKATKDLFVKLALRAEQEYIHGSSTYNVIAASGTPATTVATTPRATWAKINQHSSTPVLEARYTGTNIKDLTLYFNGSLRNLSGMEKNTSAFNVLTAASGNLFNNNVSENHGNYTFGANWRQSEYMTVRSELFRKSHQTESTGFGLNLGDYYLLDSDFTGVKLTVIAKPTTNLTSTTRYVFQSGTMQVTGFLPTFPAYDSCDAKNHTFSETVDWSPSAQCYVQLSGTYVFNTIGTVYPRAGITPATSTNSAFDTNNIVQNSKNDYVTANLVCGWVLAKSTDAQVQYTYYRANNYNPSVAAWTLPYGAGAKDYIVTAGIKHKFNDKMVINAKVGYCDSKNDTTGGFTNFKGPLAYVSLDYAL
jgi:hypothetical protein